MGAAHQGTCPGETDRVVQAGKGQQGEAAAENGKHAHGIQNSDTRLVRLPHINSKGGRDKQQNKGDETKRIWIQGRGVFQA